MKEKLIEFETAKLAKEKGFTNFNCFWPDDCLTIGRPTQSLLQKWLREVHNIEVISWPHFKRLSYGCDVYHYTTKNSNGFTTIELNPSKTYEDALELGLQEALKLIK